MTRRRSRTLARPMPLDIGWSSRSSRKPIPSSSTSMIARPFSRQLRIVIEPGPTLRDSPCLIEFSTSGCRIMLGTIDVERVGADLLAHLQLRAEPHDLDVEVLVDRLELLAQRDEVLVAAHQPAQQRPTA